MQALLKKIGSRIFGSRWLLLKNLPKHSEGVEIGVWKGAFSIKILQTVKPSKLHLVDPWCFQKEYPRRWYGGKVAQSQVDMDVIHDGVATAVGKRQAKIWRMKSAEFFKAFDGKVDWVYIDGNHLHDFVLADLHGARGIVKAGGVICGDDFNWTEDGHFHVKDAVVGFCKETGLSYKLFGNQFFIRV